ncbi:MAG: hypothetical protein GXZ07_01350 [Firmicutes bacterium]|nr:hypothetical protein [Bacillota bacterium]
MYLHIGNSRVVSLDDIVGMFNINLKNNQINTQFLENFPGGYISKNEEPACNTFIVTKDRVCYSPISPLTLQKRINKNVFSG